jgi:hypothetical protein
VPKARQFRERPVDHPPDADWSVEKAAALGDMENTVMRLWLSYATEEEIVNALNDGLDNVTEGKTRVRGGVVAKNQERAAKHDSQV